MKVSEISSLYGKHEETVRSWMDNWESKGIAGLFISKGRGRKPALSTEPEAAVELVKKKSVSNP